MISAFGVEHGELSKADRQQKLLYGTAGAGGAASAAGYGSKTMHIRAIKSGKVKDFGSAVEHIGGAMRGGQVGRIGLGVAAGAGGIAAYRNAGKRKRRS